MDQWFIALDKNGDRAAALESLKDVNFIPNWGENVFAQLWKIVPIGASVASAHGACLFQHSTMKTAAPTWMPTSFGQFLRKSLWLELTFGSKRPPPKSWTAFPFPATGRVPKTLMRQRHARCLDRLRSSHRAVLQKRSNLKCPADLYLEGSDQHRGWFQSSLWTSVIVDKAAPYKNLLTHGFIVKEDGTKLSKSDGAARPLNEWIGGYGADIIRLWICSQDYRGDVPVSDKIVKNVANNYRNLRNTLRFQIGNLHDFNVATDAVPLKELNARQMGTQRVIAAC